MSPVPGVPCIFALQHMQQANIPKLPPSLYIPTMLPISKQMARWSGSCKAMRHPQFVLLARLLPSTSYQQPPLCRKTVVLL